MFFRRWLCSTNHKDISTLYLILGVWGSLISTFFSLMMRIELVSPQNKYLIEEVVYNHAVTSHSLVMIFFFLMPTLISSFSNWLIPLYMSVPDMAFPRMNNLSFWLLLPAVLFVLMSSLSGSGFSSSWTLYPPLSSKLGTPNMSMDYMIFAVHLASASSIMSSVNFMSTIIVFSGKGFDMSNIPLLIWAFFMTVYLLVFSLPVLAAAVTMLLFDRNISTSYFDYSGSSDPILFQHLFWFFSHPEVYVLILPSFGVVSTMITYYNSNSYNPSYYSMLWSISSIGVLGAIVWAHHMFTIGMDMDTRSYFTTATLVIGIPTSVKVFTWASMMPSSDIEMNSSMLFVYSFLYLFTISSVTSLVLANASVDLILHDTYFVVAHFHYVLSLSAVTTLFASFYHWFSTMFSMYSYVDIISFNFWTLMLSVNLVFFPMHALSTSSMPRRYTSYNDELLHMNEVSSISLIISLFSAVCPFLHYIEASLLMDLESNNFEDQYMLDSPYSTPTPLHTWMEGPLVMSPSMFVMVQIKYKQVAKVVSFCFFSF